MDRTSAPVYHSLGYSIINVSWQIKETLRKAFLAKGYDVTSDQFSVLLRLWEQDGLSQVELCQRTCKNKSNLTRILDSMEKRELLFRQMSKKDRRSYHIFLTEKGKGMENDLVKIALQVHSAVFKGVSEDNMKLIQDTFQTISRNTESINADLLDVD